MYITAVDLGSSYIKAIVADVKRGGGLVVVKTVTKESRGIKRGEIIHPEDAVKSLFNVLSELKRFDRRTIKHIVFGVSTTRSKMIISRAAVSIPRHDHEILPEDVDRVIRESMAINLPSGWHVAHSFPREFIIDDIEVDTPNVVGLSGKKLGANVVLIALFSSVHKNFERIAQLVLGKKGDFDGSLFFAPLACERALLSPTQKELGVVLIDIGAGTTSIVAYQEGRLITTAVLAVGSSHITNDLAVGLKCSVDTAEAIKVHYGVASARGVSVKEVVDVAQFEEGQSSAVSKKFIAEIIEARVREIFSLVADHLEGVGAQKLPAGAIITGGGSALGGILDVARDELRLSAHIGVPRLDEFDVSYPQLEEDVVDARMSVACGLLLHKFDLLKGDTFGLSRSSSYNLNESWFKRFLRTLLALD